MAYKTLYWGRKLLVCSNAARTQLVLFDHSNDSGSAILKIDGSIVEEKSFFKTGSYILSIAKTAFKKIGALFVL